MIFKTITDELGNTKLSINNGLKGLFSGDFFKKQSVLSDSDISALQAYNAEIERGVSPATAYYRTLREASDAANNMAHAAGNATVNLEQIPKVSKAGQVALKGLAIAGNMLAMWAISEAISFIVKGIDNLANSAEHCKERVDELVGDFESGNNTIQQHSETISKIASRYSELSHGVNELGGNVSLTNEEYAEYQDICNQIADMYPTLVKSYDEQGNAILKLKGNVEGLTQALLDEKKANAAKIIESDEIMENYQNTREHGVFDSIGDYFSNFFDSQDELTADMISEQEKVQKYKDFLQMSYEDIKSLTTKIGNDRETIIQRGLLSKLGIDSDTTKEEFATFRTDLEAEIVTIQSGIDQALSSVKKKAGAYLLYNEDYSSLSENEISVISSLLNNIDEDTANSFGNDDKNIAVYVNKIVNLIHNAKPEVQKAINDWFILGEDVDISTRVSALDTIIQTYKNNGIVIPVYFENQKKELDTLQKNYDDAITKAKNQESDFDWDSWFKENSINTQEEIDRWNGIAESATNAADARKKYTEGEEVNETDNLSGKSFKQIWDSLGTGTDEASKKVAEEKENLLKLAEAGQLTEEAFKNSSVADTFTKAGYSISEATKKVNGFIENVKQLNSMKTGISAIISAYDEKKDASDKRVGADTLNSMYDTLGVKDWSKPDLKVWEQYKEVASSSKSTMKELKSAQDDLATSFVNSNNFLSNITDGTKDYYISLLREMGVTNAVEVATKALETKTKSLKETKDKLGISSKELKSINLEEADALDDLDLSADGAAKALYDYMIQKIQCGNIKLDTATECTNLYNLALKAGIAASKLRELLNAQIQYNTYERVSSNVKGLQDVINSADDENKEITFTTADGDVKKFKNKQSATNQLKGWGTVAKNAKSRAENNIEKFNKKNKVNLGVDIQTQKGSEKDKKEKNSSSKDKSKSTQVIDWIERRLNRLQSTIDYTSAKLQNLFSIKAKSNNLNEQIKETTKLINAYGMAATKYKAKANSVKLSGGLKKAVREGRLKGYSMKELIATYGEKTADKITKYQDYYDKYQSARQSKEEKIAARRQLKIDQKQLYVDNAEALYNVNEARKENAKTASKKNYYLNEEIANIKESYKYQKQIAKIQYGGEEEKAELARLEAEQQKKLLDIEVEKHQNTLDELDAKNELFDVEKENVKTAKEKNDIISQQEELTRQIFAEQIAIAKLQYGNNSSQVQKLNEELNKTLASYENEKFQNIQTEYENTLERIQSRIDGLDASISLTEAKGVIANKALYEGKLAIEKENLGTLYAEKTALEEQHRLTEVGTEDWYSQESALDSVNSAIGTAQQNMVSYNDSIREARNSMIELKKGYIDLANSNLDNFESYLSRYELTSEKTGGLTEKGIATLAKYRNDYASAKEKQAIDSAELNRIADIVRTYNSLDASKQSDYLKSNNYDSFAKVKEDYENYSQLVQDDISNQISAEENIINLMKERYNAELAYIQKLIEDRKTQLSQEKDLYDYQKSIQEKVDNISLIQKQLDALRADGSEEAMAKRNTLQEQLDDAKEDLMDVEYDRYIADQQNMLDDLSEKYQSLIEDLLLDVDTLLQEGNKIAISNGQKFEDMMNAFTTRYDSVSFNEQQSDVKAIRESVEKEQQDADAANAVIAAIEEIGTVDYDGEGRGRLVNAENLYKSLTDTQRKIVQENPNGLTLLQKKQQEWVALQAPTQTSMPTSQPSSTPQQSATEAKRAEERKNQQKAQFEQLIKNTYWQNAKYGTNKLFKDNGKETDYTKVQKKIAKNYKRDDFKYVNADWIKEVCKRLGIAQSAGSLLNYMNGIGFSKGGIVETLSKVPGRNGDDGWATLKRGEAVLTPEQTKMFQNMVQVMPPFVNAMNTFTNIPSLSQAKITPNQQSISMGDLVLNLPNVTDTESFIKTIKTDTKVQKAIQQTVCDQLSGRGKLNIMKL